MTAPERLWNRIEPALDELRAMADQPWSDRETRLLRELGLGDAGAEPVVAELLRTLAEMPDTDRDDVVADPDRLRALIHQVADNHEATPDTDAVDSEFAWVSDDLVAHMMHIFGQDWQGPLAQDLAARWGADWQSHPGDHKAFWLADLIRQGQLAPAPDERAVDAALTELTTRIGAIPGIDALTGEEIARIVNDTLATARS
jgi:hypothetical protein